MIGAKTVANATLADALAKIDFEQTNAELDRLVAEREKLNAKIAEAEAEAQRLAGEIRDWTGPDAEDLADRILAGETAAEVASTAPSREALVEARHALLSTIATLQERTARVDRERDQVAHSQRLSIVDAAAGFIDQMRAEQAEAAEKILAADAAMRALHHVTACWIDGDRASKLAVEGLTKGDGLLGYRTKATVPADVVAALKPLEAKAKGLRAPVPAEVVVY
jgi:chromosome segregation ATPase